MHPLCEYPYGSSPTAQENLPSESDWVLYHSISKRQTLNTIPFNWTLTSMKQRHKHVGTKNIIIIIINNNNNNLQLTTYILKPNSSAMTQFCKKRPAPSCPSPVGWAHRRLGAGEMFDLWIQTGELWGLFHHFLNHLGLCYVSKWKNNEKDLRIGSFSWSFRFCDHFMQRYSSEKPFGWLYPTSIWAYKQWPR